VSARHVTVSIVTRAAKVGLRFDVRGLRDFVLIDEETGATHEFQSTDALKEFLERMEQEKPQARGMLRRG
jgi:hypothetical protein